MHFWNELFSRTLDLLLSLSLSLCLSVYLYQFISLLLPHSIYPHSSPNLGLLIQQPANILLMGPPPSHDIRLCDFGLAQLLEENIEQYQLAGTTDYMAPEVINFESLTTKSDIWSVGVLTYVLLSGMSPFNFENGDDQNVRLNITKCNYDFNDYFDNIPEAAIEFIKSVLVLLHRDRPTAKECLKDVWFEANDNKENKQGKVENRRSTQNTNIKIDVKKEDKVDIGEKITEILNEVKDRIQSPTENEKNKTILSNQINSPGSEEMSCSKKLVIEAKTPTRQSPLGCRRCLAISVDDEPAKRSKCFEYSPPIKS
ncbi:DgyrCDS6275 [Dimorphilus gyrociliatus]|uniref:DgyrCDS6275 n=1 Tax=Dimorphilus gyrociliatus TaxID=2664684 RepID=A0A7I8VMJ8_9ANNE|nr:DgyrCDS6275 [Dimorphilus gyrociliatus]